MAATNKGGRPHKGDRVLVVSRPHRVVAERVKQEADEAGVSMSEYVSRVLAVSLGLDQYAPQPPAQNGPELLPLGRTA